LGADDRSWTLAAPPFLTRTAQEVLADVASTPAATPTLVIYVIRTAGRPWASRPSAGLACGVGACVAAGVAIPFTPVAPWLGMTPLPPLFFAILLLMIARYLTLVEIVKH
jgi:hypothetical protein